MKNELKGMELKEGKDGMTWWQKKERTRKKQIIIAVVIAAAWALIIFGPR